MWNHIETSKFWHLIGIFFSGKTEFLLFTKIWLIVRFLSLHHSRARPFLLCPSFVEDIQAWLVAFNDTIESEFAWKDESLQDKIMTFQLKWHFIMCPNFGITLLFPHPFWQENWFWLRSLLWSSITFHVCSKFWFPREYSH